MRIYALLSAVIALGLFIGAEHNAQAEKSDRNKPVNIEADRLTHDDIKQVSTYTGNVVLTKGTIILKGEKLVIRQDAAGYQYGVVTGKQASFRQKRDVPDQFIEGYGLEINYDGKTEVVRFIEKALVRRIEAGKVMDEIQGKVVIYDARNENYTVESGNEGASVTNPNGRVRVTLQPKNTTENPASTPSDGKPSKLGTSLQPANSLNLPK